MTTSVAAGVEPDRGTGSATGGDPGRLASGDSARGGSTPRVGPLRDRCLFAVVLGARVHRALLLTLVAVAMLPATCSLSGFVVRTGSMEPSIAPGDVVIGQPFGTGEKVPVGRVMIFRTPPGSGAGPVLRVHRVVENLGHDRYTTAGDANPTPDAAQVPRENFRARAIIRVPYVGLPLVWLTNRQYLRLFAWFALTVLLLALSFRPVDGDPPHDSSWWRLGGARIAAFVRLPIGRHGRTGAVSLRIALVLGAVGALTATTSTANAAFTDRTANGSNTWRVATNLVQAYTSAVLSDAPYAFHRLDESSGSNAYDASGNNRTGSYTAAAGYQQEGALPNNPGYSVRLAGNGGRIVGGGTGLYDPTTFSVELWFKTTTTTGGKLIGFESARDASSLFYDREAFMLSDGRVVYMGGTSSNKNLVSPSPLNNGAWHHLVVTSRPTNSQQESAMYVDAVLVASGNTTKAAALYTGWWRVGYGKLPILGGMPPSANFTGSIDDVAIYRTELSATRVAAHYAAR